MLKFVVSRATKYVRLETVESSYAHVVLLTQSPGFLQTVIQ